MHTYTSMLCNSIGQLQLSAGCSEYCRMHRACTGFVQHGNTAKYRLQGMSDRIDTREQACTSIFECSAALTVQLRLFAIYSTAMRRVCAACLETRYPARSTIPTQHFQIGAVMSASMLGPVLFLCRCLLLAAASCCVVTACTGFVHQANTARYSLLGMFDRVNTRKQSMHTYIRALAGFTTRIGQQPLSAGCSEYCRMHRVCATCHHSQVQPSICLMGQTIATSARSL
jgi:hypothetical protein